MAALRVVAAAATLALLAAAVAPQAAAEPAGVAELEGRAGQLRAALAAHPSSFEAALELASTLHQLDHSAPNGGKRVPEAAAAYRRAAELAPQAAARAAVLSNLAALLLAGGRVAEAAEVMTSTLALARELGMEQSELYVGTLFNLAKAEQQLGRQEAAQRLLREVLRRSKGVAGATYTKAWAALKQFTPEERRELEEAVRYLRRSARGVDESSLSASRAAAWRSLRQRWGWLDGLGAVDRSWIFWGAFHAFQQEGRYDLAWRALHEGNSLQDAAQPYDPQQDETLTQSIMRMFQPPKRGSADPADAYYAALMQGAGGHRDPRFRPIFVAGLPRSGSTLIEQVLASHSQVWGAGEDTALAPLLPELLAVLNSQGNVEASRIAAVGRKYADEMWARLPPERQQGRDGSSNGGGSGSSSSGDGGQDQVRWIVDKMLRNWWHIGFIAMMLPDACIVHAVRHPADAGLSCFAQPFEGRGTPWASNLSHIAHQIQLVHRLGEHWDAVLPGRVLHVRYEDLVRDQEATTRRLLDHCGIPWQDAVLRFHETQRTVATASLAQVRQRLYSSSVGRWRRYARQLAPLLRPLRQLIARYERQAGLDSSEQLMAEVLEGSADEQRGGSGSSGGGSGGAMRASALGTLLALSLALGCWARQQPVQGRPNRLEGQPASPAYCQGRALAQPPPPPPAAEPPPRFSSNVDVQWSVLRASHGGGIVQDPDSGLRYIAVPGAATLGTVLRREPQANASACAAACTRQRNCAAFNWCPTGASPGCRMDSSLSFLPPGSCHTIQPTAILTPSILPLLASGSSLQTIAGAPLAPDLLALPQYVPGYDALLGFSLFGVGNNVPCPESFADNYCALASELPALAAACDSKPWCTTVNTLLAASMGVRMVQGPVNSLIGVLKAVNKTVQPHHLCYTPFSALYTQHDRVPPLPAPPPYSLPATTGQPPVPASPQPGTAASPPGTSPPSSAAPPPALPDDHDMFWSILRRPQGELRRVGDVWVIAAPNVPLPGITVSGQSVEPSFDACVRRCVRFPDCYSFTYCPADSNTSCVIGTMGVSSIPPGGCLLLYEEGVAKTWSIPILAWGPSMKTMGGIPVTSPANNSVPGYHQHLGQALLGAHDIPKSLCPDSTRLDFCRVEATLEEAADRCNRHPNCTAFTFREVPLPGETNRSSAVLKGGPTGTVIDPSKVNWNPGLSLYVKEGSPLADAAPLPRPGPLVAAASSPQQQQQQQQVPSSDPLAAASASSDLSPGLIAGIAVPAVLAAAVTLAAALLVCRRRRRRQDGRRISLGAGASGHVYKVLLGGHTQCAAKIVEWHGRQHSQLHFVQEAAMLRRLRHPNVVGFQGVVVTEERGILLMEFCAGKDLDNCMHSRSRATGERVFNWYNRGRRAVLDIATGLAYLHSCRVLHLDLKPHNVLLSREGVAKIGDVGFSRLMSRTHLSVGGIFGTYDWAAPEVLMGRGATEKSDVWSLGVIIWELCSGLRPRRGQLTPLRVSEDCPAEVAALQVECVHSDPARRPSAAEIVQLLMQLPPSRRPAPQTPASRQPAVAAVPAALVTPVTSTAEAGRAGENTH
ncbi:serine threonine- kinase receptor R831 [Chlorella sorokiniana]|uniref:Serine threonine-kinase receptor R831 n=1 Tax=Chlorella sorokiniana TaxID=3076 RepID=A0A2P6TGU7_CHLSO|nr:serine threonine- kinase receptor R831 [Chlorella sorokiniana]|eukprot:PRW33326.1 serine threonine- kinase receptor R831 [Chlorella sorokiniana]